MKNKLFKLLVGIFTFVVGVVSVDASANISMSVSSSSVTKGTSVTVTTTVSATSELYTIIGSVSCSGAGVNFGGDLTYDDMDTKYKSKSFTHTIKPTSAGTITCKTSGVKYREIAISGEHEISNASASIKVTEPVVIKKPTKEYSSNNNLKSLEVSGFDLTPKFDKGTKEYTVEVPNDTEKVTIKASSEDANAKISGAGEKEVTEGTNKIEVKVTAENGNEKVYIITVNVKELDPIEVTVDKKKYTIVRKKDNLEVPENYEESTITLGEDDVLCFRNKNTKNILIALKDEQGTVNFYSYDEKKKTYKKYNGFKIGNIQINILDMAKDALIEGYTKSSFNYNNNKIEAYKGKGTYYLIYGQNEITGKKGLYLYDSEESTLQRFDSSSIEEYKKKANDYFLYFLIATIVLGVSIITVTTISIVKKRKRNINKKGNK